MISKDYKIKSDISQFNIDFIEEELEELHYSEQTKFNVRLVVEEIVTNIMKYSKCTEDIHLNLIYFNKKISVRLADSGIKFNPLSETVYRTNSDLDHATTDGLGILLAKQKSQTIFYKRIGKFNILSMDLNAE